MAFDVGAKVKVYDADDSGFVGQVGTVAELLMEGGARVRFEGSDRSYPFDAHELTVVNRTVIEGYLTAGFDNTFHLDETSVTDALVEALRHKKHGMKHRITIEEAPQ